MTGVAAQERLDRAFETYLIERQTDGLTMRQHLWLAFAAGAKYTIQELSGSVKPEGEAAAAAGAESTAALSSTTRVEYYECGEGYAHPVGDACAGQCVLRG